MAFNLEDNYEVNDSQATGSFPNYYLAQTFQASSTYTISKVELLVYREGTPGDATIEIQGSIGGAPDNSAIASGTLDVDSLTTNSVGEWATITLTVPVELTNGVTYAIVMKPNAATNASNRCWWKQKTTGTYANGTKYWDYPADGTWTSTSSDLDFRTYSGEAGGNGIPVLCHTRRLMLGD